MVGLLFGPIHQLLGQETTQDPPTVIITLMNGKERIGQILSDDGRELLLKTEAIGLVYIPKNDIERITEVEEGEIEQFDGDFRNTGPFTTRYYFTTNALPVQKRDDYAMIHVYGPEVHFSVSNQLSLGIMTTWGASPFILAGKFAIPTQNEKLNFAIGTLIGSSGYLNQFRGYGGLHWATVTFGDRMRNLSFSGGFGYVEPGFDRMDDIPGTYTGKPGGGWPDIPQAEIIPSPISAPAFSVAGITKVGKRASLFFDSMVFFYTDENIRRIESEMGTRPNETYVITVEEYTQEGIAAYIMPGMRIQRRANRAFQVALAGVIVSEKNPDGPGWDLNAFPIPTCAWLFKF